MNEFQRHLFRYTLLAVVVVLTIGTIFYHVVEKWSFVDAYYFSVVTLTTIGYGDLVPTTEFGKIFTTFYIFSGVGIITAFLSAMVQRMKLRLEKRKK